MDRTFRLVPRSLRPSRRIRAVDAADGAPGPRLQPGKTTLITLRVPRTAPGGELHAQRRIRGHGFRELGFRLDCEEPRVLRVTRMGAERERTQRDGAQDRRRARHQKLPLTAMRSILAVCGPSGNSAAAAIPFLSSVRFIMRFSSDATAS